MQHHVTKGIVFCSFVSSHSCCYTIFQYCIYKQLLLQLCCWFYISTKQQNVNIYQWIHVPEIQNERSHDCHPHAKCNWDQENSMFFFWLLIWCNCSSDNLCFFSKPNSLVFHQRKEPNRSLVEHRPLCRKNCLQETTKCKISTLNILCTNKIQTHDLSIEITIGAYLRTMVCL